MRERAIIDLITDVELHELAKKLTYKHADDLIQEVALMLLEMSTDKWNELNEGGYLRYYVVRTIMNMGTSPRSTFAVKYKLFETFADIPEGQQAEPYDEQLEQDLTIVETLLEDCYWYDREIVKLWIQEGSYRKVQAVTGIPYKSVGNTVKKTLNNLKDDYDDYIKRNVGGCTIIDICGNIDD